MSLPPFRTLLCTTTAVVSLLLAATTADAVVPGLPPGVTLPPRHSDTTTTTLTADPPSTSTTTATTTPSPATTAPETKILEPATRIIVDPPKTATGATTTTTKPGDPTGPAADAGGQAGAPPPSLSPGQVDDVLRGLAKSGANSTSALLEALRPLQNLGMTAREAAALGIGQFPVEGLANWTDDFGDPRTGPPPHSHQGNDLFTQFDTPVRAPADGTVRFETGGLGGLAAYVTTADGTYYYMAHLNSFAPDLANGAPVKQGRIVGLAGDSGNAKGGPPHVHFEIHPGGGAAVNPKLILDGWVAAALARVPELLASFQAPSIDEAQDAGADGGIPQILVATGMTRRFSMPAFPAAPKDRGSDDFNRAVLAPLTPTGMAPLLDRPLAD